MPDSKKNRIKYPDPETDEDASDLDDDIPDDLDDLDFEKDFDEADLDLLSKDLDE